MVSVVVPMRNEQKSVPELLATLEPFIRLHELILVDGVSTDGTYESLQQRGVGQLLQVAPGRARQMNEGARVATGHVLLFLHADTSIDHEGPDMALREIDRGADAGCFKIKIRSAFRRLAWAAHLQTLRSIILPSGTGDQAIFVRREVFFELGGFDEQMSICEDLDFVRRLVATRGPEKFTCIDHHVTTSGRRWEQNGINRTIGLMWGLRLGYHLGVPPERLRQFYGEVR